jgi:hypothetical protein
MNWNRAVLATLFSELNGHTSYSVNLAYIHIQNIDDFVVHLLKINQLLIHVIHLILRLYNMFIFLRCHA